MNCAAITCVDAAEITTRPSVSHTQIHQEMRWSITRPPASVQRNRPTRSGSRQAASTARHTRLRQIDQLWMSGKCGGTATIVKQVECGEIGEIPTYHCGVTDLGRLS